MELWCPFFGRATSVQAIMEIRGEKKRLHFDKFMVDWFNLGEGKKKVLEGDIITQLLVLEFEK